MPRKKRLLLPILGVAITGAGCSSTPRDRTAAPPASISSQIKARRYTYTPRPYPVNERGFSPVDKALAKAFAREELVADDADGSLNPYVLRVVAAYPLDGTYPYHASTHPNEYDIYNGVTQDLWFKGMIVAKAYPDGSRCSYCCGLTFEIFFRAMQLRNVQKGLDPEDFNGMTFHDLFNMLQIWYIEGSGDCEQRAIVAYGLGRAIRDFDDVRPGDFLSYSTAPAGGHSVVFIDWLRDEHRHIVGMRYFSSNLFSSKGVGYGEGRFSDRNRGRGILRDSVRIARVGAIGDYRSFDRSRIPARNAYAPNQPPRLLCAPGTTVHTSAPATTVPVRPSGAPSDAGVPR